jgi:hypothetical protein
MQALEAKILIDVVRHVDICAFRGCIRADGAVFVRLFLVIVVYKAGRTATMPGRGDHDDAAVEGGRTGLDECIFQEIEEQEVCEMVGVELGFEAVCSKGEGWDGRDTGVANEDIEPAASFALEELFCACANASSRHRQVRGCQRVRTVQYVVALVVAIARALSCA